ncbi:7229_t:CDS:2 [Rhizophagus irregularis]|nr:7229_t:CDS:2 [Rhizophagus irregularis]
MSRIGLYASLSDCSLFLLLQSEEVMWTEPEDQLFVCPFLQASYETLGLFVTMCWTVRMEILRNNNNEQLEIRHHTKQKLELIESQKTIEPAEIERMKDDENAGYESEEYDLNADYEIRSLTRFRSKLPSILAEHQKKIKSSRELHELVCLNCILDLSDEEVYKSVKKSLNRDQLNRKSYNEEKLETNLRTCTT